jgi:hypothetical protein
VRYPPRSVLTIFLLERAAVEKYGQIRHVEVRFRHDWDAALGDLGASHTLRQGSP